jgi:hypothetical protein
LKNHLPTDWQIMQVASSGCPAALEQERGPNDYCSRSNNVAMEAIRSARPSVVLIAQRSGHDIRTMGELKKAITAMGVKHVVFVGPAPAWRGALPSIVVTRFWGAVPERTFVGVDRARITQDGVLSRQAVEQEIEYVSLTDYFCNTSGCRIFFGGDFERGLVSYDYGHFTPLASDHLAQNYLASRIIQIYNRSHLP